MYVYVFIIYIIYIHIHYIYIYMQVVCIRKNETVPPGELVKTKNLICTCFFSKSKYYIIWFQCRIFAYMFNLKTQEGVIHPITHNPHFLIYITDSYYRNSEKKLTTKTHCLWISLHSGNNPLNFIL